jgi:hypothetical protein
VDVVTLAGPSEERPAQAYVAQDDVARDNTGHGPATLTVSPLGELVVSPANATNPTGVAQSLEKDTVPELLPLRPFVASWAAAASHHAAVAPAPEHRTLSHGVLDQHPIELEAADDTQADALTIPAGTVTIGGLRTTAPSAASASAAQPGTAEQPSATQKTGTAQKTGDSTSTEQQAKHVSITVKAASKSWTYDGEEHSDADVSLVSGTLKSGDVLEAEVDGTVTDVADTAAGNNVVKSAKVLRGEGGKPLRIQGTWVSDDEVQNVVDFIKDRHGNRYDEDVIEHMNRSNTPDAERDDAIDEECDDRLEEAVEIVIDAGQASISMLQRKMRVGYARAGRLIDEMCRRGIVSEADGAKPRVVLITKEQFYSAFTD